jgi:hypothetical protein
MGKVGIDTLYQLSQLEDWEVSKLGYCPFFIRDTWLTWVNIH